VAILAVTEIENFKPNEYSITNLREPRKIKNFTPTEAYKKMPCGAKGSNKLCIKMTELRQAASY